MPSAMGHAPDEAMDSSLLNNTKGNTKLLHYILAIRIKICTIRRSVVRS